MGKLISKVKSADRQLIHACMLAITNPKHTAPRPRCHPSLLSDKVPLRSDADNALRPTHVGLSANLLLRFIVDWPSQGLRLEDWGPCW